MSNVIYNIRIDQNLKDRAFSVFESYGLAPAQAIKLFLNQVADTQTVPLSFNHNANRVPNAITKKAMIEAIENRKNGTIGKSYMSLDEMMNDIQGWQE
jgi:DNA-damage-inducible protein J